ncbi:Nucleolar protein 14 [Glycine soja]|uniref:Nucleolar protein 14 n=1 Tax=Glycine soja TaxID=3848 RepID=A0A0B2NQM1_GLYSO|nr:Nucleolar protein 14 [Glycine soja]
MLPDDIDAETDEKLDLVQRSMQIPGETSADDGEENRHKSKKEVMEEIISKSKFYKAQKAKDKEENENLVEELDKDFTSLIHSEALLSLTEPNKMNALKALVNKSISNDQSNKDQMSATRTMDNSVQEKPDDYDKLVKQMGLEMRARPSDRTKTPEEIAQEEKERLEQLEVFYGVLLQYFAVLANKEPLNVELLNMLVKPLIEMSKEIPYFAAICARRRIEATRKQFIESIKQSESSSWPSSKTLCLLRLWSMIFPCSDFRHPVMTPVILLMCEYLMRCPIVSGRDIAIGSFLCSMLLSSRKFCPEAIIFLRTSLLAATESKHVSDEDSQLYHLMELKALKPLLCIHETVNEISPLNFFKIIDMPEDSSFFTSVSFRASVLVAVVETLQGYVNVYEGLSSFPEMFLPIFKLLNEIAEQKNMPNALRDKIKDVAELIKLKVDEHHTLRRPLQMRKQKPVPIKLLNPKFEENYVKGRDYDPDREQAELRKLKKQLKCEAKGAARELRKDNYFLLEVKEKERSLQEKDRAEKYGRAKAFLQEQEHAFKSGQLGKGRKRRR